jgi:hypothetical protein
MTSLYCMCTLYDHRLLASENYHCTSCTMRQREPVHFRTIPFMFQTLSERLTAPYDKNYADSHVQRHEILPNQWRVTRLRMCATADR